MTFDKIPVHPLVLLVCHNFSLPPNSTPTSPGPFSIPTSSSIFHYPHYPFPRPQFLKINALLRLDSLDLPPDLAADLVHEDGGVVVVELGAHGAAKREPGLLRERGFGGI